MPLRNRSNILAAELLMIVSLLALLPGCSDDTAHTDFITIVQKGKNAEMGRNLKVIENYKVNYKVNKEESEAVPYTAVISIEPKTTGATWKLAYEYRDNQWRFLKEKSRKFMAGSTDGIELTEKDNVWEHFATKDIQL